MGRVKGGGFNVSVSERFIKGEIIKCESLM